MKGQMFIAGTVLFIVLLVLMRGVLTAPTSGITQSTSKQIDNLAQEYRYMTGLSPDTDRFRDLSEYLQTNVQGFDAIYAFTKTQPNAYTLTIGNFMGSQIGIEISATGSTPSTESAQISNKGIMVWNFVAPAGVELSINYSINNIIFTKSLSFTTFENQTISWFDIGFNADGDNIRRSDVQSVKRATG